MYSYIHGVHLHLLGTLTNMTSDGTGKNINDASTNTSNVPVRYNSFEHYTAL
jgi:hypothetical protein